MPSLRSFTVWMRVICLACGVLALATMEARTAVPQKISYQGQLTDASGNPLQGDHAAMFVIYNDATEGVVIWSEAKTVTADSNGVFSTILGSVTPVDCSFAEPRWLEVYVDGLGLTPRREIVSVASALDARTAARADAATHADDADNLDGLPAGFYALAGHSHSALNAADGNPADALYLDQAGRVGVNTTPDYQLSVKADATGSGCRAVFGVAPYSGDEPDAYGVVGETWSSNTSLPGAGVMGQARNTAGGANGVTGFTSSEMGSGVFGWAGHTSGRNYGVTGVTSSPNGYAGYFWGGRSYFQGKVGIGTDSPARLLHLYEGPSGATPHSSSDLILESDGSTTIGFLGGSSASQGLHFGDAGHAEAGWIVYDHSSNRLRLGTGNVERVCIVNDHKVGIGTLAPERNLHIAQDVNDLVGIRIENNDPSGSSREGIVFANEDGDAAGIYLFDDDSGSYPSAMLLANNRPGGYFRFHTGGSERARIGNDGRVGIGTASPTARLDVSNTQGYGQVRMRTSYTPTSTTDPNGNTGDIAWDANYVYVKTAAGWKRAALSTWGL